MVSYWIYTQNTHTYSLNDIFSSYKKISHKNDKSVKIMITASLIMKKIESNRRLRLGFLYFILNLPLLFRDVPCSSLWKKYEDEMSFRKSHSEVLQMKQKPYFVQMQKLGRFVFLSYFPVWGEKDKNALKTRLIKLGYTFHRTLKLLFLGCLS